MAGFCFYGCLLSSCKDDSGNVGLGMENPDDKVYVFNDSSMIVNTYTYQQPDSIYLSPSNLLLGYNVDNKIGKFQNNFMTEVNLSSFNVDFGENPVFDSLVLYLDYSFAYGDTMQFQNITVYELNKNMALNDTANSINGREMTDAVISEYYDENAVVTTFSFQPHPGDSLPLTVKLPDEFGQKFLNEEFYHTQDSFASNIFRGFYFVAQPLLNGGSISYFLSSGLTRLQMYYHNDEDTTSYIYNINNYTYRCNIFKREYSSDIKYMDMDAAPDTSKIQDLFYIKYNNAFEGRIEIKNLQNWKDSGDVTINKALIDVYAVEPETVEDSIYYPLAALAIYKINENNEKELLQEYFSNNQYSKINYSELPQGKGYRINIKKTLFDAIHNGEETLTLLLAPDNVSNKSYANRFVLKGTKNGIHPKLRITYVKIKSE